MDEKKKKNMFSIIVSRIFIFLFICYFVLFVSEQTGYYEYQTHKQIELTDSKIKQFEEDVQSGKNINIKDYIEEKDVSYQNVSSSLGMTLSNNIENIVTNGLDTTFSFLDKLFKE